MQKTWNSKGLLSYTDMHITVPKTSDYREHTYAFEHSKSHLTPQIYKETFLKVLKLCK